MAAQSLAGFALASYRTDRLLRELFASCDSAFFSHRRPLRLHVHFSDKIWGVLLHQETEKDSRCTKRGKKKKNAIQWKHLQIEIVLRILKNILLNLQKTIMEGQLISPLRG